MNKVNLVVGFDQVEAVAYHTFCQSVLEKASIPVQFLPLSENSLLGYSEKHTDGSNKFIYTRFLTPWLNDFDGWAIYADGDMVCLADIKELWDLRDPLKAVQVAKHDYKTRANEKYLNKINENYPRKNWSSLILWNCSHPAHKILTPEFIEKQTGAFLHRFSWLSDDEIGELPLLWNWLAVEYEDEHKAKLVHYTLGTPCFKEYKQTNMSVYWHEAYLRMTAHSEIGE
jgi:lipopolysaccharide biosynthesis glycosyltransferase